MLHRRRFIDLSVSCAALGYVGQNALAQALQMHGTRSDESLIEWVVRAGGDWDEELYKQMLGAANEFKEGDAIEQVAAQSQDTRVLARRLLANTTIAEIDEYAPQPDELLRLSFEAIDSERRAQIASMTLGELKTFLLNSAEEEIHRLKSGLSSDVIGGVVRLMSNDELIRIGQKVFNSLPNTNLGARGYMGARIQPNSPTDHVDDIRWQVLNAFAFAVGDVLIGTNPVSSDPDSVVAVERALQEILSTFGLIDTLPHCVLAHVDVQAEAEKRSPGSTALWFQSIAGNDAANKTFDISVEKMTRHALSRSGKFGLYFETGQGADFTNGHGHGMDMVLLESRKYGWARALSKNVAAAQSAAGHIVAPWVHVNDVAGFIGPEVFRTREQLVRCCLEDIAMGKLHGLTIGLDICSTLHMDVSLDDLGWCIDQIMPANPAYIMALPTRIDPMLGYLTTSYHDHVRIRQKFGYRVDERMWDFFKRLGVIDADGNPTIHFGDPSWVYSQYCKRRGDRRSEADLVAEAKQQIAEVRSRGVFLAEGYGKEPSLPNPTLADEIQKIYAMSKESIWKELPPDFAEDLPHAILLKTRSQDRADYILHPTTGEQLLESSLSAVRELRKSHEDRYDVQLVVSDGLNALAVAQGNQLVALLKAIRTECQAMQLKVAPEVLLVRSGRVRAGYRIGETLFGERTGNKTLLHIVGERPGSGHNTLSIYKTTASGQSWGRTNSIDHNTTQVVSGIASTALQPEIAAADLAKLMKNSL